MGNCPKCGRFASQCATFCENCGDKLPTNRPLTKTDAQCSQCPAKDTCNILVVHADKREG